MAKREKVINKKIIDGQVGRQKGREGGRSEVGMKAETVRTQVEIKRKKKRERKKKGCEHADI